MDAIGRQDQDGGKSVREFAKSRFNVYFNKVWGSKAFFMHLVRYGTACEIAPLLRLFADFKKSKEYRDIVAANAEKSVLERSLKLQRDDLRRRRHGSKDDLQRYLKAKSAYEALQRGGAGVCHKAHGLI